jgi:hypothetical protein
MDECDKGEEMNPMEQVSNNGENFFRLLNFFFFFNTCGVILRFEECYSDEIPKCLTSKKSVVIWKPEHSCEATDFICFNLFLFLFPKG